MQTASKLSNACIRSAACTPLRNTFRSGTSNNLQPSDHKLLAKFSTKNLPKRITWQSALGSHSLPRSISTMASAAAAAQAPVVATDPKVAKLREILATADNGRPVDAFIIPSEDPHMSEYPPDCDARRAYISNFDGSAGTAVVTTTAAALWTDGRYFLQAEAQLGPDWTLMRAGTPGVPEIHEWLIDTLPEDARVAIDPTVHTIESAEKLQRHLKSSGRHLVTLSPNPIDAVWAADRPAPPNAPLRIHSLEWAGYSVSDKLALVRVEMAAAGAGALAVAMLDEVAWLMNLRGGDVAYNPVFLSYAVVTTDSATLFVDSGKVTPEVEAHLAEAGVTVKPYDAAFDDVRALAAAGVSIWMDPARVSFAMKVAALEAAAAAAAGESPSAAGPRKKRAKSGATTPSSQNGAGSNDNGNNKKVSSVIIQRASPVTHAKSVKNEVELTGMREAHLRDAVALIKFFCWLDKTVGAGGTLTECEVDEKLTGLRAAQAGFVEPSFPTIAGAGPNGAVIHYRPMPESCRTVDGTTLLLLDSGGQYDCGTTDVTRTVHMGTPTPHQRACFTAVLQGHIQLDAAIWPEGTPGCALDTLARSPLWRMGLNYRHGTGHGVGAALNVHEGPQSISPRFWNTQPLLPGMVCSNEPGYYEDGAFGIRIENLFIIEEAPTEFRFGGQPYYRCERLTMCPLQKKMIDVDALSVSEKEWVNAYHAEVLEKAGPRLEAAGAVEELAWLKEATAPL